MGSAATATATDSDALFWNPARLTLVSRGEFSAFRSTLYVDDATYHAGFFSYPTLDYGTFAVGYQRIGVGSIERRDDRNLLLGEFSDSESHVLLGYGREFSPGFSLGTSLRVAQQTVDGASDLGLGLDVGASLRRALGSESRHWWNLGLNLQNVVEPTIRLEQEDVPEPRSVRLGAAYDGTSAGRMQWTLAGDLVFPRMADTRWGVGAELGYDGLLRVRGGLEDGSPTFGFGIEQKGIHFDYALRTSDDLSRNDLFTVSFEFGASVSERQTQRLLARQRAVDDQLESRLGEIEVASRRQAKADGERAMQDGRYEDAVAAFRSWSFLDPENESARTKLAQAELQMDLQEAEDAMAAGEVAGAAARFQRILEAHPGSTVAAAGLAKARSQLENAADRERQLANLFREALDRYSEDELGAARSFLDELLKLEPGHALGQELLAKVESRRIENGERALAQARSLADQSRFDEAVRRLDVAGRWMPERDLTELRAQWSEAYANQVAKLSADRERSRQTSRGDTQAKPKPRARPLSAAERARLQQTFREGLAAFQAGNFEQAIAAWQTVWSRAPELENVGQYLVKAYLYQGINLYSQGEYERALERCSRVLEIDANNEKAQRYLARIREEHLQLEEIGRPAR